MIKPAVTLQELQARIGSRAKSAPAHRFWGIYVHMTRIETLKASYQAAKGNGGSPGIDGLTFARIEEMGLDNFLRKLADELSTGTYRALPYRKVQIPKSNGKTRTISIAAIRDRVVQGAAKLILEPIFEADFSDSSMGARPGRRAHEALGRVQRALRRRQHRVVDLDLAQFFDNITHRVLLAKLARRIQDPKVLAMLKWFLKGAGKRGIPQGSPLSPLLANIALHDLDTVMDRGQPYITYVRYLDDIVVLAYDTPKGRLWGERALQRIQREAAAIGVEINETKTCVIGMRDAEASFCFLGFTFRWVKSKRTGGSYALLTPSPKKLTSIRYRISDLLRRHQHLPVAAAVRLINPVLRGWVNYFRAGHASIAFSKLKNYTLKKIRRYAIKQRKRCGFGWKRWSNQVIYARWGLYNDYTVDRDLLKAFPASNRNITPA